MSFWGNARRPEGLGGKLMVSVMNLGHRPLAAWGMRELPVPETAAVLDCGCGGGAQGAAWAQAVEGMTVYSESQLRAALTAASLGVESVRTNKQGWIALLAQKER